LKFYSKYDSLIKEPKTQNIDSPCSVFKERSFIAFLALPILAQKSSNVKPRWACSPLQNDSKMGSKHLSICKAENIEYFNIDQMNSITDLNSIL